MQASTWFDLVIGVDIHAERLLLKNDPLPFPHPFIGLIFDPLAGLDALVPREPEGESTSAGLVLIHNMPVATVGMEARNCFLLPHFIVAPGTEWASLPDKSGPMVLPPPGDALLDRGSAKIRVMGAALCRSGDSVLSCSEPERLPSAYIVPIPKGMPVLVSGEETVEGVEADGAGPVPMKLRWRADPLRQWVGRMKRARVRNLVAREACTLRGHGVDIATGRVCLRARDLGEGGAIFDRHYISAFCYRESALGYGWTHSLDERLWVEPGRVVYWAEDGRELELDTFEMDGREPAVGESWMDSHHRITLRRLGPMQWELERADGSVRRFGPVKGDRVQHSRLLWRKPRTGPGLELHYDERGLLRWARDEGGGLLRFAYDGRDRMVGAVLTREAGGEVLMEKRFSYSAEGDLIEAVDMRGARTIYEYASHLLVRETDSAGISFYFGYDGRGPDAYCMRAWDSAGSYDDVIDYDKAGRLSYVTDSLGKTVMYAMDAAYGIREVKASAAYSI